MYSVKKMKPTKAVGFFQYEITNHTLTINDADFSFPVKHEM